MTDLLFDTEGLELAERQKRTADLDKGNGESSTVLDPITCIGSITCILRPLLIDSDVTVSTVGQKCSRVLGEK